MRLEAPSSRPGTYWPMCNIFKNIDFPVKLKQPGHCERISICRILYFEVYYNGKNRFFWNILEGWIKFLFYSNWSKIPNAVHMNQKLNRYGRNSMYSSPGDGESLWTISGILGRWINSEFGSHPRCRGQRKFMHALALT